MAIVRTAGTEIIRTVMLEEVNNTVRTIIFGEQHHIYTVLSIIVKAEGVAASGNYFEVKMLGYDVVGGTSAQDVMIFRQDMQAENTFVWNDKFSFCGHEPTDFAGPLDDATKQNAVADQGSSVAQKLLCRTQGADNMDVICTFIDQNNA